MAFSIRNPFKRKLNKSESDNKDVSKLGREQFKKLIERGTDLPVVLL